MSNFQNPTAPPTGGSHLPHAHPSSFEMRTVPDPTRGVEWSRSARTPRDALLGLRHLHRRLSLACLG
jgi:hypothetical protein